MDFLRIAGIIEESIVDGQGFRYVIFTQGCHHACLNCHNKHTHSLTGGYEISFADLIKNITKNKIIQGVTLSGGEPLLHSVVLLKFVRQLKKIESHYDYYLYTGFTFEEILKLATPENAYLELLKEINYLIDGKFETHNSSELLLYRGSKNQRIIDVRKSLLESRVIIANFEGSDDNALQ